MRNSVKPSKRRRRLLQVGRIPHNLRLTSENERRRVGPLVGCTCPIALSSSNRLKGFGRGTGAKPRPLLNLEVVARRVSRNIRADCWGLVDVVFVVDVQESEKWLCYARELNWIGWLWQSLRVGSISASIYSHHGKSLYLVYRATRD